jgi:ABC-2 type transport system permease protein
LDEFGTFLVGIALVWYSLIQLQFSFSLLLLFELFVLFFFGLLTLYSIILIFSSLSFFFTRMTALHSVYDVITKALRIPINIITKDSFIGNSLLFPLLIVATLPSQILLGYVTPIFITLEIIGSLAIFMVAHKFFYFALRHYSSASS